MRKIIYFALFVLGLVSNFANGADCSNQADLRGINLPGGGFASSRMPGKYGFDYKYPPGDEINLYVNAGFNAFRVAFLWERVQPELYEDLNKAELDRLDAVVQEISRADRCVVLDLHNYGTYRSKPVGTGDVPTSALVDVWVRLSEKYGNNSSVIFSLMNEPYRHDAESWAAIVQNVLLGVRSTGAKNLVLLPGTRWSSSFEWLKKDGALSNAEALSAVLDSEDNVAYEMHLYFDKDSSGTSPECVNDAIGASRIADVSYWLKRQGRRAFIGEFGASTQPVCLHALDQFLQVLAERKEIFLGWTYWAGSRMFGNYMFNIYPPDPEVSPQMKILRKYLP